jgi:hypothetical protein
MDKQSAQNAIISIIGAYKAVRSTDRRLIKALTDGKLYELYVLSRVVQELRRRGFQIRFVGKDLKFKASPGLIRSNDPHFDLYVPGPGTLAFKIYTDIEFETLGSTRQPTGDESCFHEIDIIVVDEAATGRPSHQEVALGVECKATANFDKSIVREALGVRRELSYLQDPRPSRLSQSAIATVVMVPAEPASEYWVVFIDPKGLDYAASPAAFGIDFRHWEP